MAKSGKSQAGTTKPENSDLGLGLGLGLKIRFRVRVVE